MTAIKAYLRQERDVLPLLLFRIVLGGLFLWSSIRFWAKGWIEDFYLSPDYHFRFWGWDWLPLASPQLCYFLYSLMLLAALGVLLGAFYRWSMALYFLLFTYFELWEKCLYLNHYYFVSLLAFLLCFVPLHCNTSVDAFFRPSLRRRHLPNYYFLLPKFLIAILYIYAALAKLEPDWWFRAQPLSIWLSARSSYPILGPILAWGPTAFLMSWAGFFYDLLVPFGLSFRKTRPWAYLFVLLFHAMTAMLFSIGLFPYVMMGVALVFFSAEELGRFRFIYFPQEHLERPYRLYWPKLQGAIWVIFFSWQLLFPWRFLLYEGPVCWQEQGFRFSWRVMLVEKVGQLHYRLIDQNGRQKLLYPEDDLAAWQLQQLRFQPDMILAYAKDLGRRHGARAIYAESWVSWNGRPSAPLIAPNYNLLEAENGWKNWDWVLPAPD